MTFVDFKNEYKKLIGNEERIKFIDDRINQLLSELKPIDSIGMGINGSYASFIASDVLMQHNFFQCLFWMIWKCIESFWNL